MPKPQYDLQVHRPNVLVSDMDRALRIYRDILGFKVNFLLDALDVATDMFGLPPDTKMRMAFLSEGKGTFGSLAISEARGIVIPKREPPFQACVIIELKEGRLPAVVEQLRAEGCEMGKAFELEQPTRTDIAFTDPFGNRVVIFEIHPRKKDAPGE